MLQTLCPGVCRIRFQDDFVPTPIPEIRLGFIMFDFFSSTSCSFYAFSYRPFADSLWAQTNCCSLLFRKLCGYGYVSWM